MGPSGSGKSTLLKLIAQLETPEAGTIRLHPSPEKGDVGYVFQDATLLPWLTVEENVYLPFKLGCLPNIPKTEKRKATHLALDRCRFTESRSLYPSQLSGGMKMRTSIARAWVTNPKLILMDEPFSALDERSRDELQEELRGLWKKNRPTILFVTHSLSEALFLGSRIIGLSERPAKLLCDFRPELPEDRSIDLKFKPVFSDGLFELYKALPWVRRSSK